MPAAPPPSEGSARIDSVSSALRIWFREPRAHGQLLYDRRVTWLELFYDLVFVVLVSQITHRLAEHITTRGVLEYLVMYLLVWLVWLNGSYYQELHGQNDGRSRLYIFAQMSFLVVMTVYAAHAVDEPGQGIAFGIAYFLLVVLLSYQWWHLRSIDRPEFRGAVAIYVSILFITGLIVLGGAFVADGVIRSIVWGVAAAINVVMTALTALQGTSGREGVTDVTESWAERMGLFVIVVLGEVVVGVGAGIAQETAPISHLVIGMLMLFLGFAIWWSYFDFVGRREPRRGNVERVVWISAHMLLAGAIAAVGAGMVSMIEHAEDAVAPPDARALISGSLAVALVALSAVVWTMPARPALKHAVVTLGGGAVYCVALAFVPVPPVVFALLLPVPLWVSWTTAFVDAARAGELIVDADEVITSEI